MKKAEYLEQLEYYLDERDFSQEEIDEILEDYEMMIDEALDNQEDESSLVEVLGKPKEIVRNLKKKVVFNRVKSNRLVALSPFIASIAFFVLGFGFDLWHPGWMVYLLIPITGILSSRKSSPLKNILELTPFIAVIVFFLIGLMTDVWHPTWMIFLLIPAVGILENRRINQSLWFGLFLLIALIYLLSYYLFPFEYNWLILLLLVFPSVEGGVISFRINGIRQKDIEWQMALVLFLSALIFILVGVLTDVWHPTWVVFLSIPLFAILRSAKHFNQKIPLVAIMPFVSVTLFFLAGEFLNGYAWAWLFFFLIPMTAIIQGDK